MSCPCTCCASPDRATIDAAIVSGDGDSDISRRFGIHQLAVARHREHVKRNAVALDAGTELDASGNVGVDAFASMSVHEQLSCLRTEAYKRMMIAQASGDGRLHIASLNAAKGILELVSKMAKDAGSADAVNGIHAGVVQLIILPWDGRAPIPPRHYPTPEQWDSLIAQHDAAHRVGSPCATCGQPWPARGEGHSAQ